MATEAKSELVLVGVRLPQTLIDEVEKVREQLQAATPGLTVSQAAAVRVLLAEALAARSTKDRA